MKIAIVASECAPFAKTGGLVDTVHDWHEYQSYGSDEGNGFTFNDAAGYALQDAVERAVSMFSTDKHAWHRVLANGMNADLSWDASAQKYVKLYEMAMKKRRG